MHFNANLAEGAVIRLVTGVIAEAVLAKISAATSANALEAACRSLTNSRTNKHPLK